MISSENPIESARMHSFYSTTHTVVLHSDNGVLNSSLPSGYLRISNAILIISSYSSNPLRLTCFCQAPTLISASLTLNPGPDHNFTWRGKSFT